VKVPLGHSACQLAAYREPRHVASQAIVEAN
jgi:hypothetical protein